MKKDNGVYVGDFSRREDVEDQYKVSLPDDVKIVFAYYSYQDYSGDSVVLFKQGRKLYEVRGSHCSCYGLENQWDPIEMSEDALMHIFKEGEYYRDHKEAICKAMRWKI